MKTHLWLRPSAILLCLAATLPSSLRSAQDQQKAPDTAPAVLPTPQKRPASPYALEIVDGTFLRKGHLTEAALANVVDALRDLWPEANIVLAPELAKLKVAELKLRSVGQLPEALEALRVASGYRFEWRRGWPGGAAAIDPATGLPVTAGESALYVLDLGLGSQGNPGERARRSVEVFNLSGYLQHLGKKDEKEVGDSLHQIEMIVFKTLVNLARLNEDNLPENELLPDFQFHPGASLLIVIGSPDALDVARKIVTALPGVPPVAASGALAPPSPEEATRAAEEEAIARRYGLRLPPREPRPAATPRPAPATPPAAPTNPTPRSLLNEQKDRMFKTLEKEVTIHLDNVPLETVLLRLSQDAGVNIVADESLPALKRVLSVNLDKVKLSELFRYLGRNYDLQFRTGPDLVWVVNANDPKHITERTGFYRLRKGPILPAELGPEEVNKSVTPAAPATPTTAPAAPR